MLRQFELIEKVKSYDPYVDEDALNRAYVFSMKAHGTQKRASGDPYFSHPLEVAGIVTEMHLDGPTIITALLHDTVEDTKATLEEIRDLFGEEVAVLVDGVTKLSRIQLQSPSTRQAENFRKFVLAMSNDIRVLLVKLADRLHNMRTLHFVKDEKKRREKALETLEIYSTLAERIGMHQLKDELEDLAFKNLHPQAYESITKRMMFLEQEGGKVLVQNIIQDLYKALETENIKGRILGRIKKPYSIWRKMHKQNITMGQLGDLMAFRIIVDEKRTCYNVLAVLHQAYKVIPGRFKDYISTPKPNDYQSIHTSLIGPEGERIEVQIRTETMDQIAEFGMAAHWQYKQGDNKDFRKYIMLRKNLQKFFDDLLEIHQGTVKHDEFMSYSKLEMFKDQVFVFTPTGELMALPINATPLDFAYAIHSDLGNHCMAAKINGHQVPLSSILRNGDQVEITKSNSVFPAASWEQIVVTGKARANIRKYLRTKKREEYIRIGKTILQKTFKHERIPFSEKLFQPIFSYCHAKTIDDFYASVGDGHYTSHDVLRLLYPKYIPEGAPFLPAYFPPKKRQVGNAVSVRGLIPGMAVHFGRCCYPLPGDKIIGIVTTGKGIMVHTRDCKHIEDFEPERWIAVSWEQAETEDETFVGRLRVTHQDDPEALGKLAQIISMNHATLINLSSSKDRSDNFWNILLDIEVKDTQHLGSLLAALRACSMVIQAERAQD